MTRAQQVEFATDALNRHDFEALAQVFHADIEHHSVFAAVEGEVYRGIEGQRTRWANVTFTWDAFRLETESIEEAGEDLVVTLRLTGVARASGMPLDDRLIQTWSWRGEKVSRIVTRRPTG